MKRRQIFEGATHDMEGRPLAELVGQYVVLEADRGIDIGKLIRVMGAWYTLPVPPLRKHVLRPAAPDEVSRLSVNLRDADAALALCMQKARELRLVPTMRIIDAEFQFDRRKLTFFYRVEQDVYIDFRKLVRDLFAVYKTRIWLHRVDSDLSMQGKGAENSNLVEAR